MSMTTRLLAALVLPLLLLLPRPAAADLLVTSFSTNQVLRYNGSTGVFLDAFVPAGSGGLIQPAWQASSDRCRDQCGETSRPGRARGVAPPCRSPRRSRQGRLSGGRAPACGS
jgi:hypothetical protein